MAATRAKEGKASAGGGTVDAREIEKFAGLAAEWWDPDGPMRPLHQLNPTRIGYIRDCLCGHFALNPGDLEPLAGLDLLDVGCGAGLVTEPMARLGARVTGIDAAEENIAVAAGHAGEQDLGIDYRHTTAEALVAAGETFDAVLALEIVEHVADVPDFLDSLGRLVRPGGALVMSTLNRTAKSFMLAKVGAEYVLRWLPPGTHDWRRFIRPSELTRGLRAAGLAVEDATGVAYNPLAETWRLARHDLDVNYMVFAIRPE